MRILGISGSLNRAFEHSDGDNHDAAAVLLVDGKIMAAIEEERLNRIKHTDKFPAKAIEFVLRQAGIGLADLDQICYYSIGTFMFEGEESLPVSKKIQQILFEEFNYKFDEKKIYFVHHHLAHAVSTFFMSGFDRSLILSVDGTGDGVSGMILNGEGKKITKLDVLSNDDSLGIYYLNVIYSLGFKQFDEYKAMGLAPYGNPAAYRDLFKTFYTLHPEGKYSIDLKKVKKVYLLTSIRKKDDPFNQAHKDIAAALQESLEEILMHVVKHYQAKYNHSRLCLAGGVAHNCSANGKILYSGLFEDMFVQPAAHDAGCALGAALYRYHELNPQFEFPELSHVFWGSELGENASIENTLKNWGDFLVFEKIENITKKTAQLVADGSIIGWAQGKSEFGPRALGNRSIVADPRPEENKDIINEMVKKREAFRPFAPSVMEEYVGEYYEVPSNANRFPFMIFVVNVKKDKQEILGAVTHVDGTSRIQTVCRETNEKYWELIDEFRKITGIPIVLNTSFNNNAEPIVDSVQDAIVCFCTTRLNYLVVGDYLVKKKQVGDLAYLKLSPSLPVHNILMQTRKFISSHESVKEFKIKNNYDNGYETMVSEPLFAVLTEMNGDKSLEKLMDLNGFNSREEREALVKEIIELWGKRFITLKPGRL